MKPKDGLDQTKTGAGIAGASGGTLLYALFNSLPDANPAKHLLLLSVPTLTVTTSYGCFFALKEYKHWNIRRKLSAEQKEFEKKALSRLLDTNTSDEHKGEIRKKLEEYQKNDFDNHVKKLKALNEENEQIDSANVKHN